jgi:prevent-host-death family protein
VDCATVRSTMERVGVRELRQNLSVWLRRVAAGETFEVTERGRPVAILAPIADQSEAIQRLAAQGRLARVGTGFAGFEPPSAGASMSEALEEIRADRI